MVVQMGILGQFSRKPGNGAYLTGDQLKSRRETDGRDPECEELQK